MVQLTSKSTKQTCFMEGCEFTRIQCNAKRKEQDIIAHDCILGEEFLRGKCMPLTSCIIWCSHAG